MLVASKRYYTAQGERQDVIRLTLKLLQENSFSKCATAVAEAFSSWLVSHMDRAVPLSHRLGLNASRHGLRHLP